MKAILLDFDGTLVDTPVAFVRAAQAGIHYLWPDLDADAVKHLARYFSADPDGYFRSHMRGELDFVTMRQRRLASMADFGRIPLAADALDGFEEIFWPTMLASLEVYDDSLPLITNMVAAGIPGGIVTNAAAARTREKLAATGLAQYFDVVVTFDELGVGKPDPRIFHRGCQLLGFEPSEVAYVGDERDADALGARDAGLRSFWLDRLGQAQLLAEPLAQVTVISTLAELPVGCGQ